jgi:hypothetical protein
MSGQGIVKELAHFAPTFADKRDHHRVKIA